MGDAQKRLRYYTNGQLCADATWNGAPALSDSVGAGFADSGGLRNLRIWKSAIPRDDLVENAWVTAKGQALPDLDTTLLHHWWPLTHDATDQITKKEMLGSAAFETKICTAFLLSGMPKGNNTLSPPPTPSDTTPPTAPPPNNTNETS